MQFLCHSFFYLTYEIKIRLEFCLNKLILWFLRVQVIYLYTGHVNKDLWGQNPVEVKHWKGVLLRARWLWHCLIENCIILIVFYSNFLSSFDCSWILGPFPPLHGQWHVGRCEIRGAGRPSPLPTHSSYTLDCFTKVVQPPFRYLFWNVVEKA